MTITHQTEDRNMKNRIPLEQKAFDELTALVAPGPRFHGTAGIEVAASFLRQRLTRLGLTVESTEVRTPGWSPGEAHVDIRAPFTRRLNAWPMLWSGSAPRTLRATLLPHADQGLWGDSQVWRKFTAVSDGEVVAYLHARNSGPAAPQPLPIGSNSGAPHIAIGHLDGLQLSEWISDGFEVEIELSANSTPAKEAVSDNLSVHIPGRRNKGHVLVCGHYDTFWNTPGAYDNGSGTIALLLLAERWLQRPPGPDVTISFFTAEEWHLAGSRAQVAATAPADLASLDYVLNIDGLGPGDFLESSTGPETFDDQLTREVRAFAAGSRNAPLRVLPRFPPTCGTDHIAYYAAGVPAAHLTFNDPNRLHQPNDVPNYGIAANIAWTVDLVEHLVDTLKRPERPDLTRAIAVPF